ncbi:hypothetical protein BD408DRAFT_443343 [Parasitella parasitica]|nr:hypothetical protein BD408DRAFT_443343 [Parasitella parasitica]
MNEYEAVGKARTVLPTGRYAFYTLGPMLALYILAAIPPHILQTRIKQLISLPLMICLVAMPCLYRDKNDDMFCVLCQALPFSAFQRHWDTFWIHPLLYKKDAYISPSTLNKELWSSIRCDKKVKENKRNRTNVMNKRFYHLFPSIILNSLVNDICVSYLRTFTSQDLLNIQKNHPWQAFIFFVVGITFLLALFNMTGSIIQLIHCIVVGHGSYRSGKFQLYTLTSMTIQATFVYILDEWRNLMDYPFLSISLEDLWSHRWHRIFRVAWVNSAFKPVYHSIRQLTGKDPKYKPLAIALATLTVFAASGITHEYIVMCNAGWTLYTGRYMGQEMSFFVLHGVLVVIEKAMAIFLVPMLPDSIVKSPITRFARHFYVIYTSFITFPWFINSFAPWGLFKLQSFTPLGPILNSFLLASPYLRQYCGSLKLNSK